MSTITRIKCKTDNCYLISEGRNAILLDTGSGQCLDMEDIKQTYYKIQKLGHRIIYFGHGKPIKQ